jgi:hypothetical protein
MKKRMIKQIPAERRRKTQMAVVKANFVKKGKTEKARAKATIRYIQNRPGKENVQMDVMTSLIEALPTHKHQQIIDQFIDLPHSPQKAEKIFSPYYTQEYMREALKNATKRAIVQHFVEPRRERLTPSERDSIVALLEELTC